MNIRYSIFAFGIFQLFDKLANTCKNLKIYICSSPHGDDDDVYYNLPKLIRGQSQIKRLHIVANEENLVLSENFKEAILIHSNSLNDYYNNGVHNLDSLLPNFRNLKSLTLYNTSRKINLKSILLL